MADISITATSVVPLETSVSADIDSTHRAGETITAGMAVYLKSDNKWWKAKNNGTAAEAGIGVRIGVAMSGAAAEQCISVMTGPEDGQITIGATIVAGTFYCVSANYGGICPLADVGSGKKLSVLGFGYSTTVLQLLGNKYLVTL